MINYTDKLFNDLCKATHINHPNDEIIAFIKDFNAVFESLQLQIEYAIKAKDWSHLKSVFVGIFKREIEDMKFEIILGAIKEVNEEHDLNLDWLNFPEELRNNLIKYVDKNYSIKPDLDLSTNQRINVRITNRGNELRLSEQDRTNTSSKTNGTLCHLLSFGSDKSIHDAIASLLDDNEYGIVFSGINSKEDSVGLLESSSSPSMPENFTMTNLIFLQMGYDTPVFPAEFLFLCIGKDSE